MPDVQPASEVRTAVDAPVGRITLNRPKAINALTTVMVGAIAAALDAWEADDAVSVVVLDGAGERGFCAGGDIRMFRESALARDGAALEFWAREYALDARIAGYPKPVVAIMDGIVMGGGIGLAGHASHRVATERLRAAMPEVGIGFFPDVGGTHLLAAAPGRTGTHLALTGLPIGAADAVAIGLADAVVDHSRLDELMAALGSDTPDAAIATVAAASAEPPPGGIAADRAWIDACYAAGSVAEIVGRLEAREEDAAQAAAATIRTRSPTALAVTLRALRSDAARSSLQACLEQDLRIAEAFLQTPDFVEGIRAVVIDKDHDPHWDPPGLGDVTDVDRYFAPPA
ncbi:enoyl-CoA hydratase/isomerase family protein [Baekduia soli]|uniref:3-hydroxyisobutyryl-CoA hydrolase n=1 Tax=Baekduia soli TaxID=496014 RepID=A0A5B8U0D9_9ACTN|nr:enoyl-CoA hydratase/isomerase family protein [Baekduia soli]QEC46456.1 enoyl-CoA hydratase/isomerase family protein [Baekduia soli]